MFLTKFVKTGRFPFEIESLDLIPNQETLRAFKEIKELLQETQLGNNENLSYYFERIEKEALGEAHADI